MRQILNDKFNHLPRVIQLVLQEQNRAASFLLQATQKNVTPIITAAFKLFKNYKDQNGGPPILGMMGQLAWYDSAPILTTYFILNLMPESEKLNWLVYFFVLLRIPIYFLHALVLSKKVGDAFHAMSHTPKINRAICDPCNQFRLIKGDARSYLLALFRAIFPLMIAIFIRWLPIINLIPSIDSIVGFLVGALFAGRTIAWTLFFEICERHRKINFQQNIELFFLLGLIQKTPTFFFGKILSYYLHMPKWMAEMILSNIFMLPTIGLAHFIVLPDMVEKTDRYSWSFGTEFLADKLLNHIILELKAILHSEKSILAAVETIQSNPFEKIPGGQQFIRINHFIVRHPSVQKLIRLYFPSIYCDQQAFLKDPILSGLVIARLLDLISILDSAIKYSAQAKEIIKPALFIQRLTTQLKLKWALRAIHFLILDINLLFTVKFMLENSTTYIEEFESILTTLEKWPFIAKRSELAIQKLSGYRKNTEILKKVLQECSELSLDALMSLLKDDGFIQTLKSIKKYGEKLLTQYQTSLSDCSINLVESDCDWSDLEKLSDEALQALVDEWVDTKTELPETEWDLVERIEIPSPAPPPQTVARKIAASFLGLTNALKIAKPTLPKFEPVRAATCPRF